jgi:hypothetical protein
MHALKSLHYPSSITAFNHTVGNHFWYFSNVTAVYDHQFVSINQFSFIACLQATYAEARGQCAQMGLHLVVFECYSELLQLIENTKNLIGAINST